MPENRAWAGGQDILLGQESEGMVADTFDVVIVAFSLPEEPSVRGLVELFRIEESVARSIFATPPSRVRRGISQADAEELLGALLRIGARAEVRPARARGAKRAETPALEGLEGRETAAPSERGALRGAVADAAGLGPTQPPRPSRRPVSQRPTSPPPSLDGHARAVAESGRDHPSVPSLPGFDDGHVVPFPTAAPLPSESRANPRSGADQRSAGIAAASAFGGATHRLPEAGSRGETSSVSHAAGTAAFSAFGSIPPPPEPAGVASFLPQPELSGGASSVLSEMASDVEAASLGAEGGGPEPRDPFGAADDFRDTPRLGGASLPDGRDSGGSEVGADFGIPSFGVPDEASKSAPSDTAASLVGAFGDLGRSSVPHGTTDGAAGESPFGLPGLEFDAPAMSPSSAPVARPSAQPDFVLPSLPPVPEAENFSPSPVGTLPEHAFTGAGGQGESGALVAPTSLPAPPPSLPVPGSMPPEGRPSATSLAPGAPLAGFHVVSRGRRPPGEGGSVPPPRAAPVPQVAEEPDFWGQIGPSFLLPLRGPGWKWIAWIVGYSLFYRIILYLSGMLGVLGIAFAMFFGSVLISLAVGYYRACMWGAATPEAGRKPNDMPEMGPDTIVHDLLRPGLWVTLFILATQVLTFVWFATHSFTRAGMIKLVANPLTWVIALWPFLYWPMGIGRIAQSGEMTSIWDVTGGLKIIFKAPVEYAVVVIVAFVSFIGPWVGFIFLMFTKPLLGFLLAPFFFGFPMAYSHGVQGALMAHLLRRAAPLVES